MDLPATGPSGCPSVYSFSYGNWRRCSPATRSTSRSRATTVYERTNPLVYDAKTNSARSSKQAVAVSAQEPAEVSPATDGTTYVVAGTAGTPRYGWAGPKETDRNFAAGKGSGATVTADAKAQTGPYVSEQDFSETFETVDWSQARYADYGFVALGVTPAPRGQRTTMVLRYIDQQGRELDRVVFSRTAATYFPGRPGTLTCHRALVRSGPGQPFAVARSRHWPGRARSPVAVGKRTGPGGQY
jgi:hypothetical protein